MSVADEPIPAAAPLADSPPTDHPSAVSPDPSPAGATSRPDRRREQTLRQVARRLLPPLIAPAILIAITVFAGALRFWRIESPPIWGDEALTYSRICGDYRDLVELLADDGFTPNYYQALYWVHRGFPLPDGKPLGGRFLPIGGRNVPLDPLMLQVIPALGALVLMAGAFFAARRRVSRPGAWVAAAVSLPAGYWLLAKAAGAFYAAFLTGAEIPITPYFLRMIPAAAGTLMVPAMYFLARQMFAVRTSLVAALVTACSAYLMHYARDAKMYAPAWLFMTIAVALLLRYLRTGSYLTLLAWVAASLAAAGTHAIALLPLAIAPVALLTQRRVHWRIGAGLLVGGAVVAAGPVGYYAGFNQWIEKSDGLVAPGVASRPADEAADPQRGGGTLTWVEQRNRGRGGLSLAAESAGAFAFAYEWPSADTDATRSIPATVRSAGNVAMAFCAAILIAGALPWSARHRGVPRDRSLLGDPTEPGWRSTLWIGSWLVLPTYCFYYCRSVDNFVPPTAWIDWAGTQARWAVESATPVRLGKAAPGWAALAWMLVPASLVGAVLHVHRHVRRAWWWLLAATAAIVLVLAVASAASFTLPAIANLPRMWTWEDGGALHAALQAGEIFVDRCLDLLGRPVVALAAWAVVPATCWYFSADSIRRRFLNLAAAGLVVAVLLGACQLAYEVWTRLAAIAARQGVEWTSLWMPRYLAVIWPAVGLAFAGLLMRLPTRPIRYAAVAIFCAINLTNGIARILVSNEPPMDRIAAEVWASADPASPVRTHIDFLRGDPNPSHGALYDSPGRYYLCLVSGKNFKPFVFRTGQMMEDPAWKIRPDVSPAAIAQTAQNEPDTNRLVVWQRTPFRTSPGPWKSDPDPVLEALKAKNPSWTRVSADEYPIRVYWTWSRFAAVTRREYVRTPAAGG